MLLAHVVNSLPHVWESDSVELGERVPRPAREGKDHAKRVLLLYPRIDRAAVSLTCQIETVMDDVDGFAAWPSCAGGESSKDERSREDLHKESAATNAS